MRYKVLFTLTAQRDLQDSFEWYESESAGLGWEFRNEVALCIDKLLNDNVSYQVYFGEIRKIEIKRFPYIVYYKKRELVKEILIGAILHERKNPENIKVHLGL